MAGLVLGAGSGVGLSPAWAARLTGLATTATTATTTATAAATATTVSSPGTSASSLQIQAQEIADQITADGRTLDELSASYQSAEMTYGRLAARQRTLEQKVAATAIAVSTARDALKQQALLAYMAGGAPVIGQLPGRPGLDPSLTISYAEIIAGGQKAAVQTYRASLTAETREKAAVEANARQVTATLAAIGSARDQADATLAAQRQALSQVQGRLAVEVAQVEARQQAAQQAQEMALLRSRDQLPTAVVAATGVPAASAGSASTKPGGPVIPANTRPPKPAATSTTDPAAPTTAEATTTTTSATTTTLPPGPAPASGDPTQAAGVNQMLAYARAQIGKPYQWGGAGPDSFDCSGLVMMAWEQAGIDFPHLAQDQYNLTARISLDQMVPGDLVFFGTPDDVYHVGIYVGSGDMIDAPETGQDVQVQSIYWTDLLGAGRVTSSS